ncbi:MAG: NAD(P)H-binding protein [Bacteroidetes bacterium]|nr:NAD(P)H-binding protein [Bacteroidota bacterium]
MNKIVSILGCGWLGTAVGKRLIHKGVKVKGSTATIQSYNELEKTGISTFHLKINHDSVEVDYNSFFNTDVLIVSFPPSRTEFVEQTFPQKIGQLITVVEKMGIKKVLFISSTAVYESGNTEVREGDEGTPEKLSGKALLAAEKLLTKNSNFQTTILRFSGLIGGDRNPARFLFGKENVSGSVPVNLIHRDDCVNIITEIIEKDVWGEVFNASSPGHPTKKEFYTKAAKISELPAPGFVESEEKFKIVNSDKLIKKLAYKFEYPNPMDYLKELEEWAYRI